MLDATRLPTIECLKDCQSCDMTDTPILNVSNNIDAISDVISIELKPKYGSTSDCPTILPPHKGLKRSVSRYHLQQSVKMEDGRIAEISSYDPLDLFSSERSRMESALKALFNNPQNNLRVFVNGKAISNLHCFPALCDCKSGIDSPNEYEGICDTTCEPQLLRASSRALGFEASWQLLDAICCVLQHEQILPRLLDVQKICQYDIEGISRLYSYLSGLKCLDQLCDFDYETARNGSWLIAPDETDALQCPTPDWSQSVRDLLTKPRSEALNILRSYCLAATARDCSLFITLRRIVLVEDQDAFFSDESCEPSSATVASIRQGSSINGCGILRHPESSSILLYRITVVDLDRKPLAKILKHVELDRRIMDSASLDRL